MKWDAEAHKALQNVPFIGRPQVRGKIEEAVCRAGRDVVILGDYEECYGRCSGFDAPAAGGRLNHRRVEFREQFLGTPGLRPLHPNLLPPGEKVFYGGRLAHRRVLPHICGGWMLKALSLRTGEGSG